jgi:Helix-turn-helix domain
VEYLTRWRMLLAGDKLTHFGDPNSVIARSLGYESEAAFSTAFKRVMNCSPRQYSRGRTTAPASQSRQSRPRPAALSYRRLIGTVELSSLNQCPFDYSLKQTEQAYTVLTAYGDVTVAGRF